MPVNISCPHCQKALQLQETLMGKKVRCPGCKEVFTATPPEEQIQAADEYEEIQERPSRRRPPGRAAPHRPRLRMKTKRRLMMRMLHDAASLIVAAWF